MRQQSSQAKVRSYRELNPHTKASNILNVVPEIEIDLSATTVLNQTLGLNSTQNENS